MQPAIVKRTADANPVVSYDFSPRHDVRRTVTQIVYSVADCQGKHFGPVAEGREIVGLANHVPPLKQPAPTQSERPECSK